MSASPAVLRPAPTPGGRRASIALPFPSGLALAPPSLPPHQTPQPAISLLLERRDGDNLADRFTSLAVAPNETVQSVKLRLAQQSAYSSKHVLVLGDRQLLDHELLGQLAARRGSTTNMLHVLIKLSDIESVSVSTSAGRTLRFQAHDELPAPIRRSKSALTAMLDSPDRSPPPCRVPSDGQLALARASSVPPDAVVHLIIHTKSAKVGWQHQPGAKLELNIAAEATAETVAAELEAAHDVPAGSHQLVHNGEVLSASRSLASYGIDSSAVLDLVPLDAPGSSATGSPPLSSPEHGLFANWQAAQKGLAAGLRPLLAASGSGGSYFMSNAAGDKVAVLKPADEEPYGANNPRSLSLGCSPDGSGLRKGIRPGEGAIREVAAFVLDHGRFAGVPPTALVTCHSHQLLGNDGGSVSPASTKLCSLQQYVKGGDCEERGVSAFPVYEVHKIAQLDMRLGNADRNAGNILCSRDPEGNWTLTPIDHGYSLPDSFVDINFDWRFWPQAYVPFDAPTRSYIMELDAEKDLATLAAHGLPLRSECKRVFRACTLLLKMGAARGMAPSAIASIMCRELRMKSPLEKLHVRALQLSRGHSALVQPCAAAEPAVSQDKAYFTALESLLEEYLDEIVLDGVLS